MNNKTVKGSGENMRFKVIVSKGITLLTTAAYLLGFVIGLVMQAWRRIRGGRD